MMKFALPLIVAGVFALPAMAQDASAPAEPVAGADFNFATPIDGDAASDDAAAYGGFNFSFPGEGPGDGAATQTAFGSAAPPDDGAAPLPSLGEDGADATVEP